MPLEGLWWADDMSAFLMGGDRSRWRWTLMILQPPFVTEAMIREAMAEAGARRDLPALGRLRFTEWTEGRCAQVLHIGPFSDEGPTVERLHAFVDANGGRAGRHHEIYLSDIRRGDSRNWKTIIRQPMQPRPAQ
jgi:hypothetical protein